MGLTKEQAHDQIVETLHQDPHTFGQDRSRWTLAGLGAACPALFGRSLCCIWGVLKRLHIHYKRARNHLFSPDPDYRAKLALIQTIVQKSRQDPSRFVVLFADEMGIYRQPTLAQAFEVSGPAQPLAELGYSKNRCVRVAGALNVVSGQVTALMRNRVTIAALVRFLAAIRADYPHAERIYLIWDNWPLHFHPDVLAALVPQTLAYPLHRPGNWPTEPSATAQRLNLPIHLLALPTYAPWTNPIEKLWRLLRQTKLHLHRFGDDWEALKQTVRSFLAQFAAGSTQLLRYVGLGDLDQLYQSALATQNTDLCVRY